MSESKRINKQTNDKSLFNRKVKPKQFKDSKFMQTTLSNSNLKHIENTNVFGCCGNLSIQHSNIHFLNHFQSSLNISKAQLQQQKWENKAKHIPNAVPLAPPDQRHVHFSVEKLQQTTEPKTVLINMSQKSAKNLTIQTLPSISIFEEKPKKNANISMMEIKEDDLGGDEVKMAFHKESLNSATDFSYPQGGGDAVQMSFPMQSSNSATEFSRPQHSIEETLPFKDLNQQQHPKRSPFTETNNRYPTVTQVLDNKNQLKSLVKEILWDLQIPPGGKQYFDPNKEQVNSMKQVSTESPHLKNKICHSNCGNCVSEPKSFPNQEVITYSNYTQTDTSEQLTANSDHLRNVVREVISEYHVFFTSMQDAKHKFHGSEKVENFCKADKEIQVALNVEQCPENYSVSKEIQTQTSLFEEKSFHNFSSESLPKSDDINKSVDDKSEQKMPAESSTAVESIEVNKQLLQVTSKIDSLMNAFNDHLSKASGDTFKNSDRNVLSHSITTRDVSLQCCPQVVSRSTYDPPPRTLDIGIQCNIPTTLNQEVRAVNVWTQTSDEPLKHIERSDAFTQCEHPVIAIIDSCTQTRGLSISLQASEHSNSTSISSTPVSDSLFLDDVLSEGEVPWHLKFLTCHDKSAHFSSHNANESSTPSEERDYSLSEGEIHPKYAQQWYDMVPSTHHPQKADTPPADSQYMHHSYSQDLSPGEVQMSAANFAQSSSLSKGQVRNYSTFLSAGELPASALSPISTCEESIVVPSGLQHINFNIYNTPPIEHSDGASYTASTWFVKDSSRSDYASAANKYPIIHNDSRKGISVEGRHFSSTSIDDRLNAQQPLNRGYSFKAFSKKERHVTSQSTSNWSSLSSLDLSNGEQTGEMLYPRTEC